MPEDDINQMTQRVERLLKAYNDFDAESFDELLINTQDTNEETRLIAATVLTQAEDPRAVPVLIKLLDDPSGRVRGMAAIGLRECGDEQARDALIDHLRNDKNGDVRAMCVHSLGGIGGADDEIIRALDDPHHHVRISAITGLGLLGRSDAADKIARFLDDPDWSTRYFASVTLMDFGRVTPQVVAVLEALRDVPEALYSIESFAEADVMLPLIEKYPDDFEALDDMEAGETLKILRRKYGEEEMPYLPEDPLGDLIARTKSMLSSNGSIN